MTETRAGTYSHERLGHQSLAQIQARRQLSSQRKTRLRVPPLLRQEHAAAPQLSYAQERLWFLDQLGLVGAAYNMPMALRLEGPLDVAMLERSFEELIRRHESLRTRFAPVADGAVQVIEPPGPFALRIENVTHLEGNKQATLIRQLSRDELNRPFDLAAGPLLRVLLLVLAEQQHVLLMTMHHSVSDGWSLGILHRELSAAYDAYTRSLSSPLPELPVQYADYAVWQRQWLQGEALQKLLHYWSARLGGASPQLQLPTDRPRPAMESFKGAKLRFCLPAPLYTALKELGRGEGATPFMVVLSAYQVLLSRWSGQQDIVVGSPIAGRTHPHLEGLIGSFVNALALRTDVDPELTFRELLARVKDQTLEDYAHQDLPFDALVKELRPERNLTRQPLFQVMLALQNYPEESLELAGLTWTSTEVERLTTHFDLTLFLDETTAGLEGVFEYATDLFDHTTIERMAGHLRTLLEGILENPDRPISLLPLLGETEKRQLLVEWNATATPYPQTQWVHELFEEQVNQTPNAVAVIHDGHEWSYAELNRRANQLAQSLRKQGLGPQPVVGICLERGLDLIVGLLGILKAGGAYVPLDPHYPSDRLQHMLEEAAPQVVLTQAKIRPTLPATQAELICLDTTLQEIADDAGRLQRHDRAENLSTAELGSPHQSPVYVIYTSGSTGKPKGTVMSHGSMVNLIEWHRQVFDSRVGHRVLQFAAISFDVAFQEIFSTLCTGGSLVLIDEWIRKDPQALLDLLTEQGIQRLFVPPLMLQSLAECAAASQTVPQCLQDVITAGEALRISPEIVDFFKRLNTPVTRCRLHNHYGPTETHVVTALTLIGDPLQWPALPAIGRPISNTQVYLLDSQKQLVPTGTVGEIHLGGACVAQGYRGRPELTEQRFLTDPFSAEPQARMYKTGDLGRWRADGTLEYLGRNDDQVKIRGYRIELGEIEAQLAQHPCVKEAAVLAREDVPGEKRLVAYVTRRDESDPTTNLSIRSHLEMTPAANEGVPSELESLRAHLKSVLPEFMLPSAFVTLERFPLTPNGKLDRRSLPAPQLDAYALQKYEPPHGATEEALAQIWQSLLRVERIGRRDNFFELGGHSLHGIKLIAKVSERFRVRLSVISVFQHPTIQEMALVVQSLRSASQTAPTFPDPRGELRPRLDLAPLTYSQLARWHLLQAGELPRVRQIASATRLRGQLNLAALRNSLMHMLHRHEALRTRIVVCDGVPMQRLDDPVSCEEWVAELEADDLTELSTSLKEAAVTRNIEELILEPTDLAVGPLFGVRLLKLRADEHVLILAMEHMISDASSLSILQRDLFTAYRQAVRGQPFSLPEIPLQFAEYALAQRKSETAWRQEQGAYWEQRMKNWPRLSFPGATRSLDAPRLGWGTVPLRINRQLKAELQQWCRANKTTLVTGVLTAYAGLVLRWCRASEALIQFQTDGRVSPQVEHTLGCFTHQLYLRLALVPDDRLVDLLARVKNEYLNAHEHTDSSYWAAQWPRPGFTRNCAFNWVPRPALADEEAPTEEFEGELVRSPVEFAHPMLSKLEFDREPGVLLFDTADEVVGGVYFPRGRFSRTTMELFAQGFLVFIRALVKHPEERIANIHYSG